MPSPSVKTVGIISKPRSDRAAALIPELCAWLAQRSVQFLLDEESGANARTGSGLPRADVAKGSQLLVVLGGDGTLLSAARAAIGIDIPLLAVTADFEISANAASLCALHVFEYEYARSLRDHAGVALQVEGSTSSLRISIST